MFKKGASVFILGLGAVVIVFTVIIFVIFSGSQESLISSTDVSLRYAYPRHWNVEVSPAGTTDFTLVSDILFRITSDAVMPALALRFWDSTSNIDAKYWAQQKAQEAGLSRSPKEIRLGDNTFWMLSTADGPGLFETVLYRQITNRILEIVVQPEFVTTESPYFTKPVRTFLESIRVSE